MNQEEAYDRGFQGTALLGIHTSLQTTMRALKFEKFTLLKNEKTTTKKKKQATNECMMATRTGGWGYCGGHREKERPSDAENINVWNGHYYFIQMPFLCLKNLSCNGSTNAAHVKRKPRDHRWFKWERRAYAKTTCVTAISKQWICGKLGRTLTFFRAQPVC